MRITPLDVRKQEFRKGMRGLDPEEVYAFLSTVADEYESVLNDNKALRERLLELDDKVQEYRSMERTLRDTLLTAERVNVEAKDNARREANIIIKEAQIEAERALRDIKTEAMKLRQQVQQLRSQRDAYLARMKVVAESHLSTVVSAAADFKREDDAVADLGAEERLADEPVDRDVSERQPSSGLFQPDPQPIEEAVAVPQPQPPVADVPPVDRVESAPVPPVERDSAPAPAPAVAPEYRSPEPAPRTESTAPTAPPRANAPQGLSGLSGGGVDPISVIIDRMKKGQQEILSAGAGTFGVADNLEPQVHPGAPSQESTAPESPSATALADAPMAEDTDVTSEFSLDEIRRELAAEEKGES